MKLVVMVTTRAPQLVKNKNKFKLKTIDLNKFIARIIHVLPGCKY